MAVAETFLERLDRLMRENKIDGDRELCRRARLSSSAVAAMRLAEKKKDPDPRMTTLIGLSGVLGVSIDYLCLGYDRGGKAKSAKDVAIRQARDAGVDEAAIENVLQLPDDPALNVEVWQLRIDTQAAELRARGRSRSSRRVREQPPKPS